MEAELLERVTSTGGLIIIAGLLVIKEIIQYSREKPNRDNSELVRELAREKLQGILQELGKMAKTLKGLSKQYSTILGKLNNK